MARKITTEEFIERARSRHGSRYDYSAVHYVDGRTKVAIGCPVHGLFQQSPSKHINGQNCPKCAGNKKRTTADFVNDAREAHGDTYDYSKASYKNARSTVTITCRVHGDFDQIVGGHLKGQGCPKCAGVAKRTPEEFIDAARQVYGEKYDYRNTQYSNNKTPVEITCKKHGTFLQVPRSHLERQEGCLECHLEESGSIRPLSQESFIQKARQIHGDRYDYSSVEYVGTHEKVTIICREHGSFTQRAGNHAIGIGCPACGTTKAAESLRLGSDEFLNRSIAIHANKYDYSQAKCLGQHEPVKIICPEHGSFLQAPKVHMRGNGCPKCGRQQLAEHFRLDTEEFVRRAREIHGDKFDYSNVEYVNKETPVQIICPIHGAFEQAPGNHVGGQKGCSQCAGNVRLTVTDFIKKATEVHGEYYDYTDVEYENTKEDVKITCPKHGPFMQSAGGHMAGSGCSSCADARKPGRYIIDRALDGDYDALSGYLYVIHAISPRGIECWKVGVGQKTRLQGVRSIMKKVGFEVLDWKKHEMVNMGAAVVLEAEIHTSLAEHRFVPVVRFGGWNELFTYEPDVSAFRRSARYTDYTNSLQT